MAAKLLTFLLACATAVLAGAAWGQPDPSRIRQYAETVRLAGIQPE